MMGMEGLCLSMHEQPALIEEMVEFLTNFVIDAIEKALNDVEVDVLLFGGEDMAYKNSSIISPESVRRFMFDSYRRTYLWRDSGTTRISSGSSAGKCEADPDFATPQSDSHTRDFQCAGT